MSNVSVNDFAEWKNHFGVTVTITGKGREIENDLQEEVEPGKVAKFFGNSVGEVYLVMDSDDTTLTKLKVYRNTTTRKVTVVEIAIVSDDEEDS